jgi:hypothetical protein
MKPCLNYRYMSYMLNQSLANASTSLEVTAGANTSPPNSTYTCVHYEKMNMYTPQENGVSEHMNYTLMEMAQCLLHNARLLDILWGYMVLHTATILNLLPSCTLYGNVTPEEAFTSNKPSIAHLCILAARSILTYQKKTV